jgi:hypothetical protein
MPDVSIAALLVLTMKFDSFIIISRLQSGTALFVISVILMMVSSYITGKIHPSAARIK